MTIIQEIDARGYVTVPSASKPPSNRNVLAIIGAAVAALCVAAVFARMR